MKLAIFACALMMVVFVSTIEFSSAEEVPVGSVLGGVETENQEPDGPSPRLTCDLLGPTKWNHAACAAHCIIKGYHGGQCNADGVCVCRR